MQPNDGRQRQAAALSVIALTAKPPMHTHRRLKRLCQLIDKASVIDLSAVGVIHAAQTAEEGVYHIAPLTGVV